MITVIDWFSNHSRALGILRQQITSFSHDPTLQNVKSFIRPVLTRWTSHFQAARRVLRLRWVLQSLASNTSIQDQLQLCAGRDRRAQEYANKVLRIIKSQNFWLGMETMTRLLHPLTVSAHLLQSNQSRLDNVFLTFGRLYTSYHPQLVNEEITEEEREAVHNIIVSLEKRWSVADQVSWLLGCWCSETYPQDIFAAAAFLNPFFGRRRLGLAPDVFPGNTRFQIIQRVYCRLFGVDHHSSPPLLYTHWQEYTQLVDTTHFSDEALGISVILQHAKQLGISPNPTAVWRQVDMIPPSPLAQLALRLYAAVPNSAGNERVFSQFADISTKKRNRLSSSTMAACQRLRSLYHEELSHKDLRKPKHTTGSLKPDFALSTMNPLMDEEIYNGLDESEQDSARSLEVLTREWFTTIADEVEEEHPNSDNHGLKTLAQIFTLDSGIQTPLHHNPAVSTSWDLGESMIREEEELLQGMLLEPTGDGTNTVQSVDLSGDSDSSDQEGQPAAQRPRKS